MKHIEVCVGREAVALHFKRSVCHICLTYLKWKGARELSTASHKFQKTLGPITQCYFKKMGGQGVQIFLLSFGFLKLSGWFEPSFKITSTIITARNLLFCTIFYLSIFFFNLDFYSWNSYSPLASIQVLATTQNNTNFLGFIIAGNAILQGEALALCTKLGFHIKQPYFFFKFDRVLSFSYLSSLV